MLEVKTPEEVLRLIETEFKPLGRTETVSLAEALGRVLAEDIKAEEYVPDFDRSTVDGYACRAKDTYGRSAPGDRGLHRRRRNPRAPAER